MPKSTLFALLSGLAALASSADAPAQELDPIQTVTVTAKKEAVVKKLDKTVVDVSNAPRAANGSAQDLLQATPDVSVTADGRITVKGNKQVTVLVDGKPSAMLSGSGEERALALQTMSGADIAAIEVITNPSAAYNANGGAILNIVLKRNRKPGAHGQVQGSTAKGGLCNLGASGDVTRGQLSAHASLALRHDGNDKLRASSVDWRDPLQGRSGRTTQRSEVFVHRVVDSAAFGIDDAIGEHDTLSLTARHNARRSHPLFDVLNSERGDGTETRYHRISDGPNEQSDDSTSLSFSHQDSASALKAMFQRSSTDALVDKSYSDVFLAPARATAFSHGASRSARHLTQGTLDWSRPLDSGQLGLGLDLRGQVDELGNYQAALDPLTRAETPDPGTTNAYAVNTLVQAAYVTDQIRHEAWEALLGARLERMAVRVESAQAAHWQTFDPSLHLKYDLGGKAGLTLSYRRSLQRPDPRDLDPFTTYVDAHDLSRGNPGLQPQRLSAWEAGLDAQVERLSGNLGAFVRTSRATVVDARSIDDSVIVTSKQNGGQARSVGVSGSLDWTVNAQLRLGVDTSVYQVTLETPDLADIVRQDGLAGTLNLRAAWSGAHDDVSLDAHGQSSSITPLGREGATSSVNLGWKHKLGKTLSLTVNANDIFDGSRRSDRTDAATFRQSGFEHVVARRVYVGFVQKFE
ncbi:TonB-dependent receptor [Massilia sp. 9096]|uniref:TonB-dependent receptor n=1 Tax=Massilia sp. 9096 TaxID=1500894 RepID=UPI00056C4F77|nr:TonB-dependent receptor [Massilia sp. 9096]